MNHDINSRKLVTIVKPTTDRVVSTAIHMSYSNGITSQSLQAEFDFLISKIKTSDKQLHLKFAYDLLVYDVILNKKDIDDVKVPEMDEFARDKLRELLRSAICSHLLQKEEFYNVKQLSQHIALLLKIGSEDVTIAL